MSEIKKKMTDEERLALAAKLDKELDDFIDSLPKRQPSDRPLDENWLEEFETHPFFMKKVPEPGEPVHPLYEGLQQLKYDPEENTPIDLATSYKEDGNFNFKHKKYRLAILSYTEGIKIKCEDPEIQATLYNNRSAANWYLKNFRSCIRDCEEALKLKPNYDKALIRAANACYEIENYQKGISFCDILLDQETGHKEALNIRQKFVTAAKNKERDARKKDALIKKQKLEEEKITKEIIKRGIKIEERKDSLKLEMLEPHFPELANNRVYLNQDSKLVWPVVFLYPQYQIMDFIQEFLETDKFIDHFHILFEDYPDWDRDRVYTPNNLSIYFENNKKTKVTKVNPMVSLLEVLNDQSYVVRGGTPSFVVFIEGSDPEKNFLEKY